MNFRKKFVLVNGIKSFYWETNPGKKEVMVLLHGFPGSHKGLVDMANGLGNYRLIIPDLPACGLSSPLGKKHNLENYSQWLDGFLNFLSINNAIVVGHSFGSRVALVFSGNVPEKVKQLVLITPVVKIEGLIARFVSVEYEIAKFLPKHLQKAWLNNKIHREVQRRILYKSAVAKRRQELMDMENKELKYLKPQINFELFDEFYKFSLVPVGKKIKTKSLVIAGELDEVAPLDSIKELVGQLINSDLIIMKDCGHIVVGEKPLTTARIIRKWLEA